MTKGQGRCSTQILNTKLKPDNRVKPHIPIETSITRLFDENEMVHAVSVDYEHSPSVNKTVLENVQCSHGFIATVLEAYNRHQHLRITPDDVWLTISQGVSQHINLNFEKYKHLFVQNKRKSQISINASGIFDKERWSKKIVGKWPECVRLLTEVAGKQMENRNLMKLLECDYSTSTTTTITASRVVLLNPIEPDSHSKIDWTCGIPKITLEGTLEDWLHIQKKIKNLRKSSLDLHFWLDRLEPIIWQLVATYRGEVNERFWKRIAHELTGDTCAPLMPLTLSGWITSFLPYDRHGKPLVGSLIKECDLPDGKIIIPFNVKGISSLKLVSGFLGVRQDVMEETGELVVSPVIGWAVVENNRNNRRAKSCTTASWFSLKNLY